MTEAELKKTWDGVVEVLEREHGVRIQDPEDAMAGVLRIRYARAILARERLNRPMARGCQGLRGADLPLGS